jgi:hypothetical protein
MVFTVAEYRNIIIQLDNSKVILKPLPALFEAKGDDPKTLTLIKASDKNATSIMF